MLDKTEYTEQQELVNDMMMLIASFSGKVYSLQAKENAKKRKEQKNGYYSDIWMDIFGTICNCTNYVPMFELERYVR